MSFVYVYCEFCYFCDNDGAFRVFLINQFNKGEYSNRVLIRGCLGDH